MFKLGRFRVVRPRLYQPRKAGQQPQAAAPRVRSRRRPTPWPSVAEIFTEHSKITLLACTLLCFIPPSDAPSLPICRQARLSRTPHAWNVIDTTSSFSASTKRAGGNEVDKMIKWGAVVDAADRDSFIDYLSTNFPPQMLRTAFIKKR